jgi:CRP-like cAMP-binding protein
MLMDRSPVRRRNLLLAALPPKGLSLLAPHLRDAPLEQGAILQEQGERIDQVYFPHQGIISLLAVMQQGDAIETATIGHEGAVGMLCGLGPRRSHSRAMVQVAGLAARIAAERFRQAAEESREIRDMIARHGEMLLIQVQQSSACNALHAVEARLCRWLLQVHDRLESNTIKLTHEFLSETLGVRRTTVTVIASTLQEAGLIRYHRGRIEIVDRAGLEARACECYEAIRRDIDRVTPVAL